MDAEATETPQLIAFEPDYSVPPGELLAEVLDEQGMTQVELARRLGVSTKHVNQVVKGNAAVTSEFAILLERVTGVSAGLWNGMEANYRDWLARVAETSDLAAQAGWLKELPLREMIRRGLVADHRRDPVDQVRSVLAFFGVANRASFEEVCVQASFRKAKAYASNSADLAVWLRAGERAAATIETDSFNEHAFRSELLELRRLTESAEPADFLRELVERCGRCGVVVVVVPEIGKARVSGATRWLTPHRALIQLSGRQKWAEAFWFTFFHEAGHVLLHPKKQTFIDDGADDTDQFEVEADRFAMDLLIPPGQATRLTTLRSAADVRAFATEIGVGSGIVAGRLHKDGLVPKNRFNKADIHPRYVFDEPRPRVKAS